MTVPTPRDPDLVRLPGVRPPRLPGTPLLGAALELRRDPLLTLRRAERVAPVVRIDAGPPGWRHVLYGVFHPDGVEQVLVHDPHRLTKRSPQYDELRAAIGDGLFTSEGEQWHRQRRFVAPVLTRRRILGSYAPVAVARMQDVVARWRGPARTGEPVDVHEEMVSFTVHFIAEVLLGLDVDDALPVMRAAAPGFNDGVKARATSPHPLPRWVPTRTNRRLAAAVRDDRGLVDDLVARRRDEGAAGDDLLALLLAARDPDGAAQGADGALDDSEVADQVMAFLLAGHETTATTLALALQRLAGDPHWQRVVHDELDEVLAGREPTAADLPRLVWTDRVVREVLRLWPSAPTTVRRAPRPETVMGYGVPAGSVLMVSPYATQRSPDLWPDPDRFDPERFADPLPGGHRYAWFPFGAGAHACVGAQLAMTEAVLGLATLLQAYRVCGEPGEPDLDVGIVIRPAGPIPVTLTERV